MAYGDFKDLPSRTVSDQILHDKTFKDCSRIQNMIGFKEFVLQWFRNFSIKRRQVVLLKGKSRTSCEELNKPIKSVVLGVFLVRIQSKCRKKRTRKTWNTDTF